MAERSRWRIGCYNFTTLDPLCVPCNDACAVNRLLTVDLIPSPTAETNDDAGEQAEGMDASTADEDPFPGTGASDTTTDKRIKKDKQP